MDSINISDTSRITHNPHREKENPDKGNDDRAQRDSTSTIVHRKCNLAWCLGGASLAQSTEYLPDLPQIHLAKNFYRRMDVEPLILNENHRMTHVDFRQLLSKHMDVYAVLTDAVADNGAVNVRVIGKPKFQVNCLSGDFFTAAFNTISSKGLSPFSSDLIGLDLGSSGWIFFDFFKALRAKSNNNEKMSSIEKSIFKKLEKKHLASGFAAAVTDSRYTEDITRDEAKFIFAQGFDKSFKQIQQMQGKTPHMNVLNTAATIRDLPEILGNHSKVIAGAYSNWALNYLDKDLLRNVVWE